MTARQACAPSSTLWPRALLNLPRQATLTLNNLSLHFGLKELRLVPVTRQTSLRDANASGWEPVTAARAPE